MSNPDSKAMLTALREVERREGVRIALAFTDAGGGLTAVAVPGPERASRGPDERRISYPGLPAVRLEMDAQALDRRLLDVRANALQNISTNLVLAAQPVVDFCNSMAGRSALYDAHIRSMVDDAGRSVRAADAAVGKESLETVQQHLVDVRSALGSAAEAAGAKGDLKLMDRLGGTRLPELSGNATRADAKQVVEYYAVIVGQLASAAPATLARSDDRELAKARFQMAQALTLEARTPSGLPGVDPRAASTPTTRQGVDATLFAPPPKSEQFYRLWQEAISETPEIAPVARPSESAPTEAEDLEQTLRLA